LVSFWIPETHGVLGEDAKFEDAKNTPVFRAE
jgi:hypothetical protein